MARKAYFKRTVYYSEDFVKELQLFERNIAIDEKRFKDINKKYRFSAVIRKWIKNYNIAFAKEMVANVDTNK